MKKILIAGDSFATDWTQKYKDGVGWVNIMNENFNVMNVAQAGVSEYKIFLQIKNIDFSKYEHVIVSHTSAYRIPINQHPIHFDDILHNQCDLIYSDVLNHVQNTTMKTAKEFYEQIFMPEYFQFINDLIYNQIKKLNDNIIHITFFDEFYDDDVLKLGNIFKKNKGTINHMNDEGNKKVYQKILKFLK